MTALAASRSRKVVAVTVSLINATETAAPIAALLPAASPDAMVVSVACWLAKTLISPDDSYAEVPVPIRAVVVLFTSESASAGVIETPPLDPA